MKNAKRCLFMLLLSGALATGACKKKNEEETPATDDETATKTTDDSAEANTAKEEETEDTAEEEEPAETEAHLYFDTHHFKPGTLKPEQLADAHKKDMEVGKKYGVTFKDVWFNMDKGVVNCLAEAPSADALQKTHKEAHGMVADTVTEVNAAGETEAASGDKKMHLFMDTHDAGPGKLTPEKLAEAHKKDLEVEKKYHVKFLNAWFNTDEGKVHCLAEAPSADAINKVHKEAHGMVADSIVQVQEGGGGE